MSEKSAARKKAGSINAKQYGMLIALIVIYLIFTLLSGGKNASPMNINNLFMQNSYVVILAVGMLLCVLTGNVDLSVGSVVAFTGAICAIFVLDLGMSIPLAFLLVLLSGVLIGMWQGVFIAYLRVPPFVVTLANMLIFRGLTLVVLNGQTKGPLPAGYVTIGAGYLPEINTYFLGRTKVEMLSVLAGLAGSLLAIFMEVRSQRKKSSYGFAVPPLWQTAAKLAIIIVIINFFTVKLALYNGLPVVLAIMLLLIVIYTFLTDNTVPGRQIYAVGGNANAARLSGIKTQRVMFWIYTSMGLMSALAGIVLSARNASATPKAGDGFELDAIAACYIGGAAALGGSGTIMGAVVGALIMGVLNNGMSLIGWSVDVQKVVKGLVLLGAVTVDLLSKKKNA
ncbi:Xylose transport system permease protein XylH [Caprobacter fermentans]|uniref:Xylose transport system permease protein XylH n=1 Tax=Caproicibacter fermentans TaxID=2576756 RepID=A0A6N8I3B8_9FIRM|nr:multiple monosaccharide ABC transporter permease [Caproicibacter fermentans]MVB12574.1 Xylose transport system permease protein XylH [Caproicibacter fermentans]OCN00020.1 ABC transporter permease [Clostridium sp. W14A]QNK39144.1 sugar ABC transporter permease [Caproicibacter fermentans]